MYFSAGTTYYNPFRMTNCYKVLGVRNFAGAEEIKTAYRKLSKKFHPDLNGGDPFFEERFKEVQNAYELLCDVQRRTIHDRSLEQSTTTGTFSSPTNHDHKPEDQLNEPDSYLAYFTIGSSLDHVRRLQGTPTSITKFELLGQEIWTYGYSRITFKNSRVQQYSNASYNLKVMLLPSPMFSSKAPFFMLGSTKDEVLYQQGTPSSISTFELLNQEVWTYDYSRITFKQGQVHEYSNASHNLRVR